MRPMLARAGDPPEGHGWSYELSWNGTRAVVDLGPEVPGHLRVTGADGRDITWMYPETRGMIAAVADGLFDGYLVAFSGGRVNPRVLAERARARDAVAARGLARTHPVTFLACDVLRLYGVDITERPYAERRATLERLRLSGPRWRVPPVFADAGALLEHARAYGLSGVVAKHEDAPYRPGVRCASWVEVSLDERGEFVVGGLRRAERGIGGLLVGYYDHMSLRYAGEVTAGVADQPGLRARLAPLRRPRSPFTGPVPGGHQVSWCAPDLVVRVGFAGWGSSGRLVLPTLRGLAGGG